MIRTSKAHAFSKTKAPISALLLLAILAVSVRVASIYFLHIPARYSIDASGYLTFDGAQPDDREYEGRAWNLVSGGNFWSLPNGDGNAPPGYPLVIAGLYAVFGRRLVIVLALNAVLGGLAAIGTYLLSRRLMEHRAALLAGLFGWPAVPASLVGAFREANDSAPRAQRLATAADPLARLRAQLGAPTAAERICRVLLHLFLL